jgi:hypothetical protein
LGAFVWTLIGFVELQRESNTYYHESLLIFPVYQIFLKAGFEIPGIPIMIRDNIRVSKITAKTDLVDWK